MCVQAYETYNQDTDDAKVDTAHIFLLLFIYFFAWQDIDVHYYYSGFSHAITNCRLIRWTFLQRALQIYS